MQKLSKKEIKTIVLIALVPIVIGAFILIYHNAQPATPAKTLELPERNDTAPMVPISVNYGTKIVYTTDTTVDKSPYEDDCSTRGGTFNMCGNTCAPNATSCSKICALTCEVK